MNESGHEDDFAWRQALRGNVSELVRFFMTRTESDDELAERLLCLLEDDALAAGVGMAILALRTQARTRVLPVAARDPRVAVRRALFQTWAGERMLIRPSPALLAADEWATLLASSLTDSDAVVRACAATLAFNSRSARPIANELLAATNDPDPRVRWRATFALGDLNDSVSLARLRVLTTDDDTQVASAAEDALRWRRES